MRLQLRASGREAFAVDLGEGATVAELKIEATAGCDIDPECMAVVYKGKVLKNDDALNTMDGAVLHLARTRAVVTTAVSKKLRLELKGFPDMRSCELDPSSGVQDLRELIAAKSNIPTEEIHLLHKAKFLLDGQLLSDANIIEGSAVHLARRAVQSEAQLAAPVAEATDSAATALPSAWGHAEPDLQQLGQVLLGPGFDPAQVDPAQLQELRQLLNFGVPRFRPRLPRGELPAAANDWQARLPAEVRLMEFEVRRLAAQQGVAVEAELLAEMARTFAEARARGAPVPTAERFVARSVARQQERSQHARRLQRDSEGLDPELEDAMRAAEAAMTAAESAPRRLGNAPP